MKEHEGYRATELKAMHHRRIKELENQLHDKQLGATYKDGSYTYEFLIMMNETRRFLNITKPTAEDEVKPPFDNNDLTVGDI